MATLNKHTLLYDEECPACRSYTQLFVNCRMISPEVRQPYGKMIGQIQEKIDWVRASNEIALVDHESGEITYGIDSLFKVIEKSYPVFRVLFRVKAFHCLMMKLYFFISYNRKVIMPGQSAEYCSSCAPSMNYPYRLAYLLMTWLFTSWVLTAYVALLQPIVPASSFGREFLICGGQLIFQGALVAIYNREKLIYYLGNMMTVSFFGALALLPALLVGAFIAMPFVYLGYFMLVVGWMLYEHSRRLKLLDMSLLISASWLLYRFLILFLIF